MLAIMAAGRTTRDDGCAPSDEERICRCCLPGRLHWDASLAQSASIFTICFQVNDGSYDSPHSNPRFAASTCIYTDRPYVTPVVSVRGPGFSFVSCSVPFISCFDTVAALSCRSREPYRFFCTSRFLFIRSFACL